MRDREFLRISSDTAQLMHAAADLFRDSTNEAIAQRGSATVALSGGSTPKTLYQVITTPEYRDTIDWSRVLLWFGDERCVGPDDPQSNYGMTRDALLRHVPIPSANVYRMQGELDPALAAQNYEDHLREAFHLASGELPHFDLIWLGIGEDGHTASLFPGTTALRVTDRLVVSNPVPHMLTTRITFTYPVLNAASTVAFLVDGSEKASILAQIIATAATAPTYPSQFVYPISGQLLWMLDHDAAALLR